MGVESFYINIHTSLIEIDQIFCEKYRVLEMKRIGNAMVSLEGTIVSFLPDCYLMWEFLSEAQKDDYIKISCLSNERTFQSFCNQTEFISWMVEVWGDKIKLFYKDFGAFCLTPTMYYKTLGKFRKYYKKIQLNASETQ